MKTVQKISIPHAAPTAVQRIHFLKRTHFFFRDSFPIFFTCFTAEFL